MRSVTAGLLLLACLYPGMAWAFDLTGQWRGSLYGSRIEADLTQDGNFMSGVVTVNGPFGGETIYHVQGAVFDNGHMYVLHGAGHVFEGDFAGPDAIGGVLTLVGGKKLSLEAKRREPAKASAKSGVLSGAGAEDGRAAPGAPQSGSSGSAPSGAPGPSGPDSNAGGGRSTDAPT